jgi:Ca2+-binding EF-hand superfamily protein
LDANKDGRLDEAETAAMQREKAETQKQIEQAQQRYRDMIAKYDKDGDRKLSPEESRAWTEELRAEQQKKMLQQWDANGDGRIDENERKAMYEGYRKQAEEASRQWLIRRHDKDGDGVLNDQERAGMEAEEEKQRQAMQAFQQRQREWIKPWDTDGDGQLSESERNAMLEKIRSQWDQRRKMMDTDGDGKVSAEETRAYWEKLREKYDANGNGVFDADEYRKMIEEEDQGFWQGPQTIVAPGGAGGTTWTVEDGRVIVKVRQPPTTQP